MKIACVYPDTPDWPKMKWVHEAFTSLGHDVRQVKNATELAKADSQCTLVVMMHKSPGIRWPNMCSVAKTRTSFWCQWWFDLFELDDCRLEDQGYLQKFRPMLREMDAVFLKEHRPLDELQAMGINAHYLDQGCPATVTEIDYKAEKKWDLLVWGQSGAHYLRRTKDAMVAAKAGFKVAWATRSPCFHDIVECLPWTHPDDLPELASHSLAVLSTDRRKMDGYCSDRFWYACGMGCCVYSRRPYESGEQENYYSFVEADKLVNGLSRLNPEIAEETGRKARQWVMDRHTIRHECQRLLKKCAVIAKERKRLWLK
jgi:hypothetical protein